MNAAASLLPEMLRVAGVHRETRDTVSLTLDAGDRPRAFRPGEFNMLYAFAVGEAAVSLSGDAAHAGELVHTVKGVGAVSRALCALRKGSTVGVRGPFGTPWPLDELEGSDVLLIAGGLGLAPLRPVVHHLLRHRARYGAVTLLAGARTPDDLIYRRELDRWRTREGIRVLATVDKADAGWRHRVGVVPALLDDAPFDPVRTRALVCGPEVMMRFAIRELAARGLPAERVHISLERNMKCALGTCGRCQYGPAFVCRDGPVLRFDRIERLFFLREI